MDASKLISDEYRDLITKKHDARPWGGTGNSWVPTLVPILARLHRPEDCRMQVLDYGCGRGTLKPALEAALGYVTVHEYDPGVRGKDTPPTNTFDYVVCTDVMEHVEEDKVDDTLQYIEWLTTYGAFFLIVFTPAKSSLPDGRNTHITIKPCSWWEEKLHKAFKPDRYRLEYIERGEGRAAISVVLR